MNFQPDFGCKLTIKYPQQLTKMSRFITNKSIKNMFITFFFFKFAWKFKSYTRTY